jgi:hypothetical protein
MKTNDGARKLTDPELELVAFACLGERAPHFVDFIRMRIVADDADSKPQPVADYPRIIAMLLHTANYGRPN